ncbi:hypothetical protein [Endozoicomonas sp.]|uniref:hypothetical protein n=1 Tax=Endozoicomonas sp. TaxID=1892382 RepID=UPI003AF771A7
MNKQCALVACAVLLSGCAAQQPLVKDVLANDDRYMQDNLSVHNIPQEVQQALGELTEGRVIRTVDIEKTMINIEDGKESAFAKEETVYVLDNGLTRAVIKDVNNDIHFLSEYTLGYYGLFDLIYHDLITSRERMEPPKTITSFSETSSSVGKISENTEYTFRYTVDSHQVGSYEEGLRCSTGDAFPASEYNPLFSGNALYIDCNYTGTNGQIWLKTRSIYLAELDIAQKISTSASKRKREWRFTNIRVQSMAD